MAALRDGVITQHKAEIIVRATVTLEPEEAKSAEAKVLDRAGRLTPGSLRAAIARAVMEVAPKKARKRRRKPGRTPGSSGGRRTPATPRSRALNSPRTKPWRRTSGSPGGRAS